MTRVRAGPYHQECEEFEQPMTTECFQTVLAASDEERRDLFAGAADIEHRHNAPIQKALPNEASDYEWKRETGEVQSYQHTHAGSWLHIDPQGQFYDRQAKPIIRETALEQAGQAPAHSRATTHKRSLSVATTITTRVSASSLDKVLSNCTSAS